MTKVSCKNIKGIKLQYLFTQILTHTESVRNPFISGDPSVDFNQDRNVSMLRESLICRLCNT